MITTIQDILQLVVGSATIHQDVVIADPSTTTMDEPVGTVTQAASPLTQFDPTPTAPIPIHQEASLMTFPVCQPYFDYASTFSPPDAAGSGYAGDGSAIQQQCLSLDADFLLSEMLDDPTLWVTPHTDASFFSLGAALSPPSLNQPPETPVLALNSSSFDEEYFMSPSRQSSYSFALASSSVESAGSFFIPSVASPTTNPLLSVSPVQSCSSSMLGQLVNGLTIESPTPQQLLPLSSATDAAAVMASHQTSSLVEGPDMFLQPWLEQQIMVQQQEQQQPEQPVSAPPSPEQEQATLAASTTKKPVSTSSSKPTAEAKKPSPPVRRTRHACPFCTHTSNRANNMKEHIMTHYPNRPKNFKCHLCDKPFARKHDMKRHLKTHERRRTPRYPGTILFC